MSLCDPQLSVFIFRPGLELVHGHTGSYGRYVNTLAESCSTAEHFKEIQTRIYMVHLFLAASFRLSVMFTKLD